MEMIFENVKEDDFELTATLSSNDIIGVTGNDYEQVLKIFGLTNIPQGNIRIDDKKLTIENHFQFINKIRIIDKNFRKNKYLNTVKEHMDFNINYFHIPIKDIDKKEKDSLKIVGLNSDLLNKNITNLSKSEQKKIQIAISLLSNPDIIILIDPFKSLDNKSRKKIMMVLTKLKEQYNKLIIIGSSNSNLLYQYTTKMLFIKNKKIFLESATNNVYKRVDYLKRNGFSIPDIVLFTYKAIKQKKVNIEYHKDIRDIIKDIYKHV